jgi:hypothetical protein
MKLYMADSAACQNCYCAKPQVESMLQELVPLLCLWTNRLREDPRYSGSAYNGTVQPLITVAGMQ